MPGFRIALIHSEYDILFRICFREIWNGGSTKGTDI
jgi:hypothetical protein